MSDPQAQLDQSIRRIVAAIDRESNVSMSTQLKGALEFGIASGDLPDGARMPSVRQLAGALGVSPVTVSKVYATLQEAGHIEARVGSGTYVAENPGRRAAAAGFRELDRRIAELIDLGRRNGLTPADLALRLTHATARPPRPLRLLMLGNFPAATRSYAEALRPFLAPMDEIAPLTLREMAAGARPGAAPDLVIAPRTLLARAHDLFPGTEVFGLTLIPDQATRVALATVSPEAHVVAYSYFPEFVTSMKAGVTRFAPHVTRLTMVVRGDPEERLRFAAADVIVYATGTAELFAELAPGQHSFEYHHTPDSQAVRTELLPVLDALRLRPPALPAAKESVA